MANVYYKILNKDIKRKYTDNIIDGIQRELSSSARTFNEDIFDTVKNVGTKRAGMDVDNLLKYYVINQILKNAPEQAAKPRKIFLPTANKNYRKISNEDVYYRLKDEEWVIAENVSKVNSDGSYIIDEKKRNSQYVQRKLYSVSDSLMSVQLIDPKGEVVNTKEQVIELMNLRKEYVMRHKYSGYSGNSSDIVAALLNQFSSPKETGYYMDSHYNLYRWDDRRKSMVIDAYGSEASPLLADYKFEDNKTVIKKEYTGVK